MVKSSCGQHVSVLELEKQRHDVDSSSRRRLSQCHNVTMSQHVQQLKVQPIQCNETMMLNAIDLKRVVGDQNKSLNMYKTAFDAHVDNHGLH